MKYTEFERQSLNWLNLNPFEICTMGGSSSAACKLQSVDDMKQCRMLNTYTNGTTSSSAVLRNSSGSTVGSPNFLTCTYSLLSGAFLLLICSHRNLNTRSLLILYKICVSLILRLILCCLLPVHR